MISLWRIFWLELTSLWRSYTVLLLLLAAIVWSVALPLVSDGTSDGVRTLFVQYSLGGVFALLTIALLSSATGVIASERAAKRLQLTRVRPVSAFSIAFGGFLAQLLVGAFVLGVSAFIVFFTIGTEERPCFHVFRPLMESPMEEAKKMYEAYMADPETPAEVRNTRRDVVLRLLAQRAREHYLVIETNSVAQWSFAIAGEPGADALAARFRFSNAFDAREEVCGKLSLAGYSAAVSNFTCSVVKYPLTGEGVIAPGEATLRFFNEGENSIMLRPRRDVELLVKADSFAANLLRSYIVMIALLSLVIAFGIFLGSGLSRPVALFTAIVILAVGEMSPSVVEQYPDQLERDKIDSIGLYITRFAEKCTKSISAQSPLERLANGDAVEWSEVMRLAGVDLALLPLLLCFLSGLLINRKSDDF